jgi:Uma2 family endonuclease
MGEARKLEEYYTYGDYKSWNDDLRWELIGGEAFCMSPGPGAAHQLLVGNLFFGLKNYFQDKVCDVIVAPFDVILPDGDESEDKIDTVVQPDIIILCDKSKLRANGIKGAPDVVFEILSPSTARRDLDDKLQLYERAGVKEYVIADPHNRVIIACRRDLENRFSQRKIYGADDVLELETFPELKIPLTSIWGDMREG